MQDYNSVKFPQISNRIFFCSDIVVKVVVAWLEGPGRGPRHGTSELQKPGYERQWVAARWAGSNEELSHHKHVRPPGTRLRLHVRTIQGLHSTQIHGETQCDSHSDGSSFFVCYANCWENRIITEENPLFVLLNVNLKTFNKENTVEFFMIRLDNVFLQYPRKEKNNPGVSYRSLTG